MQDSVIQNYISALKAGLVCLQPTDTVPGLTFDPFTEEAREKLLALKNRDALKPLIGLVGSCESAFNRWEPLPAFWEELLRLVWPAPLSVVWQGRSSLPNVLKSQDGTVCLRWPKFDDESLWMQELLSQLDYPLPTTSVNKSSDKASETWSEAIEYLKGTDVYIPKVPSSIGKASPLPSTVIKINSDASYDLLREGAFSLTFIDKYIAGKNSGKNN